MEFDKRMGWTIWACTKNKNLVEMSNTARDAPAFKCLQRLPDLCFQLAHCSVIPSGSLLSAGQLQHTFLAALVAQSRQRGTWSRPASAGLTETESGAGLKCVSCCEVNQNCQQLLASQAEHAFSNTLWMTFRRTCSCHQHRRTVRVARRSREGRDEPQNLFAQPLAQL